MTLKQRSGSDDPQSQGANGTWNLRGRQIISWRNWASFGAGTFDRGEGEGVWRGEHHRVVFSLEPRPPMLFQFDDGPVRNLHQEPASVALYPAGRLARTVGINSRYAQVCWSPELYRLIAPYLPNPPEVEPEFFQDPLLRQLIRALADEVGHGTIDRLLADSLVAALAMRVAQRSAPRIAESQPDLPRSRLRRVIEYIEAHLDQDLTLAELAEIACLSPCHFSRSFKQGIGVGLQRYTVQRRVERAKSLLRRGDEGLAGIAAAVGFADQSHFTAAFRRETGTTPGRFRAAAC